MQAIRGLTVGRLAAAKHLDPNWLGAEFGLTDTRYAGQPAIRIPYRDADGSGLHAKVRLADGSMRYVPVGSTPTLYGLERLMHASALAPVVLVEGESDVWAAATHGVTAVGIPGAQAWRTVFALELARFPRIVLWEEPDDAAKRLVLAVANDLPNAWLVAGGPDAKDLCELHEREGERFRRALAMRLSRAVRLSARAAALARAEAAPLPRSLPPRTHARHCAAHPEFADARERARSRPIEGVLSGLGIVLRGRGIERTARCPFHADGKERRPSMTVNLERNVWHCHACGIGGDAIAFLERFRGIGFVDAVRELGETTLGVVTARSAGASARIYVPRGMVLRAATENAQ